MKITKHRLEKIIHNNTIQTRKHRKYVGKVLKHTNTARNKRPFNLKNQSLKNWF